MFNSSFFTIGPVPPGGGGDPDATAYINAVLAAGGTLTGLNEDAIDAFFVATKAAGVYSKMYRIYPFLGGVAASNKINAISPATNDLTFEGTWTQDSSGSQGDGSTGYANTHFNPFVSASSSNLAWGWYNNISFDQSGERYHGALDNGPTQIWMSVQLPTGRIDWGQDGRGTFVFPVGQEGLYMVSSKPASSPKIISFYRAETDSFNNGNLVTLDPPSYAMYLGALNLNDASYGHQNLRYVFYFISSELTQTEMLNFSTAINNLQTAFARNTY